MRRAIYSESIKSIYRKTFSYGVSHQNWGLSISNPNLVYGYFDFVFIKLPEELKKHRLYFENESRGFGERAFHVMWYVLMKKFKLRNHLEIGVYRGQILSLVSILQRMLNIDGNVTGISPLSNVGDSYSTYIDIDYRADILKNFSYFSLPEPQLIQAYSTDEIAIKAVKESRWDSIYIDGSHEYDVVKKDWELCSGAVRKEGIIVFDDAALYTKFLAPNNGFRGYEGPSKIVKNIVQNDKKFRLILHVGHNMVFQKI